MKIVIDTNIIVITLTSRSPYHYLYQKLVAGDYTLLVSNDILFEYQEIITQKYGSVTANFFLQLLAELPNVTLIMPFYRWEMIANDPDDNKFVDCGIAGQADYLVTQDRHFDVLGTIDFPKLNVINLETFAGLIR